VTLYLDYSFDWSPVLAHMGEFIAGAWLDVWATIAAFVIACLIGLFVSLLRVSGTLALNFPAFLYVQVLRGVPIYVFLFWVYYGVATVIGLNFTGVQAMIIALALTGSAYTAEIFRGGIQAVDRAQIEAAYSLGLSRTRTYSDVILPQAFRIVVPPLGNLFVGLLKGATIVSVIGVKDMVFVAQDINVTYFTPFEAFGTVGVILIVLVVFFSVLIVALERALRLP
jgi:His/Glu/Gln/Arg/opine family amino acid ABC transporter permease subunit